MGKHGKEVESIGGGWKATIHVGLDAGQDARLLGWSVGQEVWGDRSTAHQGPDTAVLGRTKLTS